MSSSSLEEVRITTGTSLVRGSARIRCSTSMPSSLGSLRSSRTTAGIVGSSRPAYLPVPNRKSSASWPSLAMATSLAMFAFLSARSVSSSSFGLSSTSRIVFSIVFLPAPSAAPSVEFRGGRLQRPGRQKAYHRLGRDRRGEEVSLPLLATVRAQEFQLLWRLDPLGDHPQSERMRERNHRLGDRRIVPGLVDPAHERAVDLQAVDGQPRQIAQARIACAEIVHGDLHAERFQAIQDVGCLLAILDQDALGELELQTPGLKLGRAHGALHGLDEAGAAKLPGGNVYGETQWSVARLVPGLDLATALDDSELAERVDQIGVLGDGHELHRRDPPPLLMMPAHQGFDPHDAPAGEHHLGLVVHFQLVLLQREPQLVLQFDAVGGLPGHGGGVELEAVAAVALDTVHRGVGVAQQDVELFAVARINARPDAQRDVEVASLDPERRVHRLADLACHGENVVRARE